MQKEATAIKPTSMADQVFPTQEVGLMEAE